MVFLCSLDKDKTDMKPNEEASEVSFFKELPDNIIDEQRVFLESVWREINI